MRDLLAWRHLLCLCLAISMCPADRMDPTCPRAPTGFTAFPSHCIGLTEQNFSELPAVNHNKIRNEFNCASYQPYQIDHGNCPPQANVSLCVQHVAALCNADNECYSFSLLAPHCAQSPPIRYQRFRLGAASVVENSDWVSYAKPGGMTPSPSPPPPPPSPAPGDIPQQSDCAIRKLALSFASELLPMWISDAQGAVYDGLELGTRNCSIPRPPPHVVTSHQQMETLPDHYVVVCSQRGDDSNDGSIEHPVRSVRRGLELVRSRHARKGAKGEMATLILRGGVHYLNETMELTSKDSGLVIRSYPGDSLPWLSGAVPLENLEWTHVMGEQNVWKTPLPAAAMANIDNLHSIRVFDRRATAARWPNADIELDRFPAGYANAEGYLKPKEYPPPVKVSIPTPSRTGLSNYYETYKLGIGGPCSIFDPPVSYWCSDTSGFTPSGLILPSMTPATNWTDSMVGSAEVFVWRSGHWNNWMFSVANYEPKNRTIQFGLGGFQGTRPGGGEMFYLSHLREALDSPGEFIIDKTSSSLFFVPNSTTADPPQGNFSATFLRVLVSMNGSASETIRDIQFQGVGFRDARATYLDPHGVPSGGDWALQRSGAIFLDHTDNVSIVNCTMERNDGNAIMVSGKNTRTVITGNDIRWTGDSAIALWGRTDELGGNKSMFGMLATDDHPISPEISHNLVHELGAFEKQSSHVFVGKVCGAVIHHNVFFNGPRAGINVNDGFCGGHAISQNIIFNTCRESGDHGPFNSWDRQPFSMTRGARPIPEITEIYKNLIFADYDGVKALDHDDGSSFYNDHNNVIYLGWGQKTFEPAPGHKHTHNSLILFADNVLTEHGGETGPDMAEKFYNNTLILLSSSYGSVNSIDQLTNRTLVLENNTYFVPPSTPTIILDLGKLHYNFTALQTLGFEKGSSLHSGWPSDEKIVDLASALLTMNTTVMLTGHP